MVTNYASMCTSHQRDSAGAGTFTRGVAEQEADWKRATVLVIDDEPRIASLAGTYLKRLETEMTVVVETDSQDALARFEAADVDCVVSDYEMPVMDGLELLAAVRDGDPTTPFILFTACDDEGVARTARECGGAYLPKRGQAGGFDRLAERVESALSGRAE